MEQSDGTQKGVNSEKLPRLNKTCLNKTCLNKTCLNKTWSEGERTNHGNVAIKHPAEIGVDKCAHLRERIQAAKNTLQNYKQSLVRASEETQTCHKKLKTYKTQHVQLQVERLQLMMEGEGIEQQMKETKESAKLRKLQCQAYRKALYIKTKEQEIQWVQSELHELRQQYRECEEKERYRNARIEAIKEYIKQQEDELLKQIIPSIRLPPILQGHR